MVALCAIILAACSTESELAQKIGNSRITVSSFPVFSSTNTRSADTFDAGKTAWAAGDEVLVKLSFTDNTAATGVIAYDGTTWNWTTPILQEADVADVEAYYAPAYEWSNGSLALKSGKMAGTEEYLKYTKAGVTIANGISIDFSRARKYSRLRIVAAAGKEVALTCPGFTANDGTTTAATAVVTTADTKGNAYFYGSWTANAQINVSVGGCPVMNKTIATASSIGLSYALEPAFMQYTINNTSTTEAVSIPFPTGGTTPAEITVYWGDGTNATIPSGTTLSSGDAFDHTYTSTGDFTITIISSQTDDTKQQIPAFNFNKNRNSNSNNKIVKSIDTPLLNTAVTDFFGCFHDCSKLTKIPEGLFGKNTAVTSFTYCFSNCIELTTIPTGLFDKNTAVTTFSYCFYNCSNLTAIPEGLFGKNTAVTDFHNCFSYCSKLKLNANIFIDGTTKATNRFIKVNEIDFRYCFTSCGSSLNSEEGGIAPELWNYTFANGVVPTTNQCFKNVTKVTNADAIPTAWKE